MGTPRIMVIDGNEAAAQVAYGFTEIASIYPITPSSPMAEKTDEWAALGRKNFFGQTVSLVEMQSEAGAIGAVHGAAESGALAVSYTSSQGLMLMIPTLHRLSGTRLPVVLHVAARTVGTHAMSIFGDHSDVMNCRQTGIAQLCTGSVQEIADLAGVAHLAAIETRIPFMHFFDGFRTSHEVQKVEMPDEAELSALLDREALDSFRDAALNPDHPTLRCTVQNADVHFQFREASNRAYEELPEVVQGYMDRIAAITGRSYHLFDYHGAPDAIDVVIAMGSVSGTACETVDRLCAEGRKVGFLQVHLYRPFSVRNFLAALPSTVRRVAVLDRTKEPGSVGEPLFLDVCAAFVNRPDAPFVIGGRYGISSKDTTPAHIAAVFDNLASEDPKTGFTVGIEDDVTHRSLPVGPALDTADEETVCCKFWGLGQDGTVGANKNSIKIIGENTALHTQAYFEYDTKKSFGITCSHLRFGPHPIRSSYLVHEADFVACHNQSYLDRYDMVQEVKPGGVFLLNCDWGPDDVVSHLPGHVKRALAARECRFFVVDATSIAESIGLGKRTNTVLQAAFFALAGIVPLDEAAAQMRRAAERTYKRKGDAVVEMNLAAIDAGLTAATQVPVDPAWARIVDDGRRIGASIPSDASDFIRDVFGPVASLKGDSLPVSVFLGHEDGTMPLGTTALEKRGFASQVPVWDPRACTQCNKCSFVCPHAVIRPFLLDDIEAASAPSGFATVPARGKGAEGLLYSLQVSVLDCTGCGCCEAACPTKGSALAMLPIGDLELDPGRWDFALTLSDKSARFNRATVKGSQFRQPLVEFSGACAGCAETPYAKLLTQLYGDRMYWANGTGCSQAWAAANLSVAYAADSHGKGVAWSNSLFENNAEFALGMLLASDQERAQQRLRAERLIALVPDEARLVGALRAWLDAFDDIDASQESGDDLAVILSETSLPDGAAATLVREMLRRRDHLGKKTVWMFGGDGWAYDIGFGGLDHVIAQNKDINVFIVDTEVYSNTGGQSSKGTPLGAVSKFQFSGKKTEKKDLGRIFMNYGNCYVASVAMGADMGQLIKAVTEAEAFPGPAVVIAYTPCTVHGIKAGMANVQQEMKRAVDAGYWPLYRFDPRKDRPFTLDSKEPTLDFEEFLRGEVRYASLDAAFPEKARELFDRAAREAADRHAYYRRIAEEG